MKETGIKFILKNVGKFHNNKCRKIL